MTKKHILKSTRRPDKPCHICGIPKSYSNFKTHTRKCSEKSKNKKYNFPLENLKLKLCLEDQKLKIQKLESEISELRAHFKNEHEDQDPITINEIVCNKSYGTQIAYTRIWNKYILWCQETDKVPSSIPSVIKYFKEVKNPKLSSKRYFKPTTLNLLSSVLRTCFKKIYSKDISEYLPNKVKFQNLKIKPKYAMTTDEIKALLKEQINDLQNFLSCYILIFSGCRVHSLSMLEPRNYKDGVFEMFDYKTQKRLEFVLSNNMREIMDSYFRRNFKKPFLFFSQDDLDMSSEDLVTKRGKFLAMKMRKVIKNSKIFEKVDTKNVSLGPHIFRTSKVHQCMSQFKDLALKECRKSIGHSDFSSAINYYLPKNSEVPLFTDLIEEIDNLIQTNKDWKMISNLHK